LSGAEVARIEQDLLGTAPAIPSWGIHLPLALSGLVAAVPALDNDLPAGKRVMSAALGLLTFVWPLATFEHEHPAQAYQRHLRRASLRIAPSGPDGYLGLTALGTF
jgi:hypothetical protein